MPACNVLAYPPPAISHRIHVKNTRKTFFQRHSLSIVSGAVLLCWIVLYSHSDQNTHWGSFFGNAIATGLASLLL